MEMMPGPAGPFSDGENVVDEHDPVQRMIDEGLNDFRAGKLISNQDALKITHSFSPSHR